VRRGAVDALVTLRLSWNALGDAGLAALARALKPTPERPAGALPRLRELSLNNNALGAEGAGALARACEGGAALAHLAELHLFGNGLGPEGAQALARAAAAGAWAQLAHLDMRETNIGDAGVTALAQAAAARGALAQCRHLDLRHNRLGHSGTAALADALASEPLHAHDGARGFASLARLLIDAAQGPSRLRTACTERRIELVGGT
jgi:hypothetical protein